MVANIAHLLIELGKKIVVTTDAKNKSSIKGNPVKVVFPIKFANVPAIMFPILVCFTILINII